MTASISPRVSSRTVVNLTPCWTWTGATTSKGYGCLSDGHRTVLAHRLAWESVNGPIPDGLTVNHRCMNKRCVNPEHLELLTPGDNLRHGRGMRTHCPAGHEYDLLNTRVNANGHRSCRECQKRWNTNRTRKDKAAS